LGIVVEEAVRDAAGVAFADLIDDAELAGLAALSVAI
jgi:hypothetical protein